MSHLFYFPWINTQLQLSPQQQSSPCRSQALAELGWGTEGITEPLVLLSSCHPLLPSFSCSCVKQRVGKQLPGVFSWEANLLKHLNGL